MTFDERLNSTAMCAIVCALVYTEGNCTKAAKELCMTRGRLYWWLRKLKVDVDRIRNKQDPQDGSLTDGFDEIMCNVSAALKFSKS
jgi:hypothetical protein